MSVLFSLCRDKAAYEVKLGRLMTVPLLTLDLTVIEFCESSAREWRNAERGNRPRTHRRGGPNTCKVGGREGICQHLRGPVQQAVYTRPLRRKSKDARNLRGH